MYCKNLLKKMKKGHYYLYCKLLKEEITFDKCHGCQFKEYKRYEPMKRHSSKQLKMEKMRFSILYKNLSICAECGIKNGSFDDRIGMFTHIDKNEVFEGSYRETSIKNGMIVPLCSYCHKKFHNNKNFNLKYKNLFENEFLKEKSIEEFISLFKKDYIYLYEKASKND